MVQVCAGVSQSLHRFERRLVKNHYADLDLLGRNDKRKKKRKTASSRNRERGLNTHTKKKKVKERKGKSRDSERNLDYLYDM